MNTIQVLFNKLIALLLLVVLTPFLVILFFISKYTSKGPFVFRQVRLGLNKKSFEILKIRTMINNAEEIQGQYKTLNEVDGPVFKIRDDPRYTKIGKFLSHTGLDESLQLINVLKGDMNLVGPRPLPKEEALKIPKIYNIRFQVMPGITSSWIVSGAHDLNFKEWMELDKEYVKSKNIILDLKIILLTLLTIIKLIFQKINRKKK